MISTPFRINKFQELESEISIPKANNFNPSFAILFDSLDGAELTFPVLKEYQVDDSIADVMNFLHVNIFEKNNFIHHLHN